MLSFGYNYKISKKSYFYNWFQFGGKLSDVDNSISLTSPYLYRTEIEEDEYEIFELVLDAGQLANDVYLSYHPSEFYQYLLREIDEAKGSYIIGNITKILGKFYIYKDIAKKPPEIDNLPNYHHKPIDIIANLQKISPANRTYLSLYQQIHHTLHSVRDGHLGIVLDNIENKFILSTSGFCLPFKFYIETKDNSPYLIIKPDKECLDKERNKNLIQ